jgi:hypothetical protein
MPSVTGLALIGMATIASAQATASTPAYCQQQRGFCRTLCSQVSQPGTAKRGNCDGGCEQSVRTCLTSGSYSFAPVEQYLPEFHKQ